MSENIVRTFYGKEFTSEDIELIKWTRKRYPALSKKEFAQTICEFLGWLNDAGKSKHLQCLKFLELLESEGVITLPESRSTHTERVKKNSVTKMQLCEDVIECDIKILEPIRLEIVSTENMSKLWKEYVDRNHMLKAKAAFGSQLRYIVKSGDRDVGCLQFSASALALSERDKWIGWSKEDREKRLHLVINNSRFLVLPWVKVKNLASHILSIAVKQIRQDWLLRYCYEPVLLETFVDTGYFKGISYQAANWKCVGETKGRGRNDRYRENNVNKKTIWMYPLKGDFRLYLTGVKKYKKVVEE